MIDFWLALALASPPRHLPAIAESLAYTRGTGRRQWTRDIWLIAPPPAPRPNQWTA